MIVPAPGAHKRQNLLQSLFLKFQGRKYSRQHGEQYGKHDRREEYFGEGVVPLWSTCFDKIEPHLISITGISIFRRCQRLGDIALTLTREPIVADLLSPIGFVARPATFEMRTLRSSIPWSMPRNALLAPWFGTFLVGPSGTPASRTPSHKRDGMEPENERGVFNPDDQEFRFGWVVPLAWATTTKSFPLGSTMSSRRSCA